jgi:lysophospholipase L1-like esterase
MKTILCYGDSNTWGADPSTPERFAPKVRWTGVLQAELGSNFLVIEEGLNGRTTNVDDINEPFRNGLTYLVPCLESHRPIDLVTIMLGTNDLKARFNRRASDIAQAATLLAKTARAMPVGPGGANPAVLLIAPPPLAELTDYDDFLAGGTEKSQQFARYYGIWATKNGLEFLDAGSVVTSSPADGIHLDPPEHAKLGKAVAVRIREMLGKN